MCLCQSAYVILCSHIETQNKHIDRRVEADEMIMFERRYAQNITLFVDLYKQVGYSL